MATYQKTNALDGIIDELIENKPYHSDIHTAGVQVQCLFYHDEDPMEVRGVRAYAYIKATSLKERALGQLDATIVVDAFSWEKMSRERKVALVDHELYHLITRRDNDGNILFDDLQRPKLKMRKHDVEVGWFIQIAQEHKMDSIEVFQATNLVLKHRQSLFDFALEGDARAAEEFSPAQDVGGEHTSGVPSMEISSGGKTVKFGPDGLKRMKKFTEALAKEGFGRP